MRFSDRIGQTNVRSILQIESIDAPLMNRLWNAIVTDFFNEISDISYNTESTRAEVCRLIWREFYIERVDLMPQYDSGWAYVPEIITYIRNWFFDKALWFEIYNFIEFLITIDRQGLNTGFITSCNRQLAKELSGYRIIESNVVQITSEEEIVAIEEALTTTDRYKSVTTHVQTALKLMSDRTTPDYRNSIKESISAIESMCTLVAGDSKANLSKALAALEKKHALHPTLKEAYIKLYNYTSDADGIRHAMLEDGVPIEFEDAKFMLVSCSAFINYLKAKLKL